MNDNELKYLVLYNCTHSVLRSLYFSLFNSHLTYGIPVWGKSIYSYKLLLLQKKIVRAISFSKYSAPTKPIFKDLNILRFDDIFKTQIASLMWDYDHGTLPDDLNPLFTRRCDIHSRNLRNARNQRLYTSTLKYTKYGSNSFSQLGSLLLNDLKDLNFYNDSTSKKVFMNKYKQSLIEDY